MKAQALLEQMAAESARATHRSKAKMEVVAVLTKVLAIIAEAESEASKENVQAHTRAGAQTIAETTDSEIKNEP